MKKIYTLLFSIALQLPLHASHIVGGDLHYECLGNNQYLIVLKIYRDCATSTTDFDNPAAIGIFDQQGNLVELLEIMLADAQITDMIIDTGDPCLQAPTGLCVKEAIFSGTVTLPPIPGGYSISYQRCCRNTTLINTESNDDIGITLTTQIPDESLAECNSNPAFNEYPPVVICLNEPFVFDHSATDLDGDSIVYELCNPLLTNVPGFYINPPGAPPYPNLQFNAGYSLNYPIDSDPAFAIDPYTGLLTGTPTQIGQYVIGICMKEYRNGTLITITNRDFQFNIAPCGQNTIAAIDPPVPCLGLQVTFGNNSTNGVYWYWDMGDTTTDADTANTLTTTYTFPEAGVYDVMLIVNPGYQCADTSIVEVPVFPPLAVQVQATGPECIAGQWAFTFGANGNYEDQSSFEWSFSGGNPATASAENPDPISYTSEGTYSATLVVTDEYCEGESSMQVEVPPLPYAQIETQTDFCEGLTVEFGNESISATEYLWNFGEAGTGDTSTEQEPEYTYDEFGTYTVTLTVNPGSPCAYEDTATFVILPPNPINFDLEVLKSDICDSTSWVEAAYTGTGETSLLWEISDGFSEEESESIYHLFDAPGTYTLTLTAFNSICDTEESGEVEVEVGYGPITAPILIPNIFTPDSDTLNSHFRMFYKDEETIMPTGKTIFDYLEVYNLKVYDRWGVLIFDTADLDLKAWDGTQDGNEMNEGVYYYILDYKRKCLDASVITVPSYVTLVRSKQ